MLDPDGFLALPQVAAHLPFKLAVRSAMQQDLVPQKRHHVGAGEARHRVMHQQGIEPVQDRGVTKDQIRGPFALVCRPAVGSGKVVEQLGAQERELVGDGVKVLSPTDLHLLIEQSLRPGEVLDPRKTVLLPRIPQALHLDLSRQPLSPVQANLNGEGKLSLDACFHETESRMNPVVAQEQAFAQWRLHLESLGFRVAVHLEAVSGLYAAQHADQPLGDLLLGGDGAGGLLLVHGTRRQVFHRASCFLGARQRGLLQPTAHLPHMLGKVLQQHMVLFQVGFHPAGINDSPQRTAQDQAIKPRQNSQCPIADFRDKVLSWCFPLYLCEFANIHNNTQIRGTPSHCNQQSTIGNHRRFWLRPAGRAVIFVNAKRHYQSGELRECY
jgi:hypothetical protein